jgi:peptidoglycan/LPS O-acetylase OafA/YrhL
MSKDVELVVFSGGGGGDGRKDAAAVAVLVKEGSKPVAASAAPKKERSPLLNQLTGMRAFASLWIVLGHYSPEPAYPFAVVFNRAWVGVSFFIFLSGFVTHYAYYYKTYQEWDEIRQFYYRRIGRVIASYYISYLVVCIVYLCLKGPEGAQGRAWYMYVLDALMITSINPLDSSPRFNNSGWTICSLVFAWLAYPFMQNWLKRTEPPSWAILLAAVVMYVVEVAISFIAAYEDPGSEFGGAVYWGERWPVTVILQYSVGMCFAHLLRRKHFLTWPHWGKVSDLIMVCAILVVFVPPNPNGGMHPCRCRYDVLSCLILVCLALS